MPTPGHGAAFLREDQSLILQKRSHALVDLLHVGRGLKTGDHVALAVDDELGEVPLDVGVLLLILVDLLEKAGHGDTRGA